MKKLITEKKKVKPDLNVMEILEDVVDIEQSILLLKRKLLHPIERLCDF